MYLVNGDRNPQMDETRGNNTRYNLNNETRRQQKQPSTRSEPCKADINGKNCGETDTLAILNEFQKLYEDKLTEIDQNEGTNYKKSQMREEVLREWVMDLTEQNTMLVQAVEELEQEASHRVELLEDKIRESCHTAYSAMTATSDVQTLANDVQNLLEVIRRARENGVWDADGLTFYHVTCVDIFGVPCPAGVCQPMTTKSSHRTVKVTGAVDDSVLRSKLEMSEKDVANLQNELQAAQLQLKQRHRDTEELKSEISKMNQSARDMRDALTAEVADKYDSLRALRRQYQFLEEQCCQLDKQAHFKDDIIKEMRKELRALKNKEENSLVPLPPQRLITDLAQYRNQLLAAKTALETMKEHVDSRYGCACQKEQEIGQLEETLMCLLQSIQGTCDELEQLEGVSCRDEEMDVRMDQARERLLQLESDYRSTGNVESLHEMLEEVKVSDMIIRIKEKNIMNQDQLYLKIKNMLKRTKQELKTLRKQAEEYLVEKKEIEARALTAETKIDQIKNELLDVYESFKFAIPTLEVPEQSHSRDYESDSKKGNTLNKLRETVEYLQSELNTLNEKTQFNGNVESQLSNQEEVISNLKQVVNYQQNTIDELEKQYNESNVAIEHLNDNIAVLENNNWEMEKEIFKLLQDEFVLEKQLESLSQHYNSAWLYYHSKYTDMSKTIDFYLNQLLKLECHLKESETRRLQLHQEMIEKSTVLEAMAQNITTTDLKVEETDLIFGEMKAKLCHCKTLKEYIKKQKREIEELQQKDAKNCAILAESAPLSSFKEAEYKIINLSNIIGAQNDFIEELKQQLFEKDVEIQQLKNELSRIISEQEALQAELQCSLCCNAELNSQLNQSIQENQQLKNVLEEQRKKYEDLKDELHQKEILVTELMCVNTNLEKCQNELTTMKNYASELEQKLKQCRCNEISQENEILLRDIEQLKCELLSTQYDKHMFDTIVQELEDDMKETRCIVEFLQNILETEADVEELRKKNLILSAELLQKDHEKEILRTEVSNLQHQNTNSEKMMELNLKRIDELKLLLSEKQLELNRLNDLLCNGKCTQECYEQTINDLKIEVDNYQNQIESLIENEKHLNDELSRAHDQMASYQSMILQAENEYQKHQSNINEKNNEINKLQCEIQRLKDSLQLSQEDNCRLCSEVAKLEENQSELNKMISEENTRQEELLFKLREAVSKIEVLEKRINDENLLKEDLSRQLQDAKSKIYSLESHLANNELELEQYSRKLQEANSELCDLQAEISRYEEHKKRSTERNKDLNETLQSYDRNLRQMSQNQKEILHSLESLQEEVEEKNRQIENYKQMLQETTERNDEERTLMLDRHSQELNERNEVIKNLTSANDKMEKEYKNTVEQLQVLANQIDKMENDLYDWETKYEGLRVEKEMEIKCLQQTINNLDQENREQQRLINRNQLTIAGNEQELSDLREQITFRDKRLDDLTSNHEKQISELELIHREELRTLRTQINDQLNNLNTLKQEFDKKSRDASRLEQELGQAIEQLQCQETCIADLKKMHEQQIENIESHYRGLNLSFQKKIADKDNEINGLKLAVEKNLRQYNSSSNEMNELYQNLNEKDNLINELRAQNEENQKNFEETQCEQYAQYQKQLSDLLSKIDELKQNICECQKENNSLLNSINDLNRRVEAKDHDLTEMSKFCNCESQENEFKINTMKNKLTNTEQMLQQYKQALNEANIKNKTNDISMDSLRQELDEKNQEIFSLQNQLRQMENSLVGNATVGREEISSYKRSLAEKDRTIRELKSLLEKMDHSITSATEEVQKLGENLTEKERHIADLRDQFNSGASEMQLRFEEEIERLKTQIRCDINAMEELNKLIEQQQEQIANKDQEIEELILRMNAQSLQIASQSRSNQFDETIAKYIKDNERLCQQLKQSNDILIQLTAEKEQYEEQLKCAEVALQKAESERTEVAENVENKYQAILNQQKAEFCQWKSDYEQQYEKELNELQLTLQEMKIQNEMKTIEATNEIRGNEEKLKQKEIEIQQLKDLIDQIKNENINQTNHYQNEWQQAAISAYMLESDLTQLRSVVEKQENQFKKIQEEEKMLVDEKQVYQEKINAYEDNVKNLCKQLSEKDYQIQEMERQFTNALLSSERELKTALEMIHDKDELIRNKKLDSIEIESLKSKIDDLSSECGELKAKNKLLESQKAVCEVNLKEIQMTHESLNLNLEIAKKNLDEARELLEKKDEEVAEIKEKYEEDLESLRQKYENDKKQHSMEIQSKDCIIRELNQFMEKIQRQSDNSRELNELQKELAEKNQEVYSLKSGKEKFLVELNSLQNENLKLVEEVGRGRDTLGKHLRKIEQYQRNIDENRKYIHELEVEIERLKMSNDQMSSTLCCAQLELEKIRKDVNHERSELKQKYDWFIEETQTLHKSEISKLEKQIKAQEGIILDLNRKIENLQNKQVNRNMEMHTALLETIEKSREELTNRERELEKTKNLHCTQLNQLEVHAQNELKRFESKVQQYETLNSELKTLNDKLNKSLAAIKKELEAKEKEAENFQSKYERLKLEKSNLKTTQSDLENQIRKLKFELSKALDQVKAKDEELTRLRQIQAQFVDQMETRCEAELENYRVEIKENLITSLDQIRDQNQEKCKEIERLNDEIAKLRSNCICGARDGASKLDELYAFIDNLKDQLRDKEKVIRNMNKNHEWESQLGDKLQSELEKILQSKDEEIDSLHQTNKNLTEQLFATQNRISNLNRDIECLKRMKNKINTEDASHSYDPKTTDTSLKDEIETMKRMMRELRHELELKKEENDKLSTVLKQVTKNRNQLRNESKKVLLNTRLWLSEQSNINENLSETIEEKNQVLTQLKDENKNLLREIEYLRSQIKYPTNNLIEIPSSDGMS